MSIESKLDAIEADLKLIKAQHANIELAMQSIKINFEHLERSVDKIESTVESQYVKYTEFKTVENNYVSKMQYRPVEISVMTGAGVIMLAVLKQLLGLLTIPGIVPVGG